MQTTNINSETKWVIDPIHSEIGFKVKHMMFTNVRGSFKEFEANIYTTGEDFMRAEIDLRLNPASINTGDKKRDAHLKSADFFDVENFKEIKFIAKTYVDFSKVSKYELYGELNMKGIKKPIKLFVESGGMIKDAWRNPKALFSISGTINRKFWGLNWNCALDSGGVLVSDEVLINCEIQLLAAYLNEHSRTILR